MAKPLIYAVVGASGCGKSTATQIMEELGIPSLVSFTTRDMRPGEINGKEHWFVTENDIPPKDRMLAYTYFGGKHYWTTIDQIPEKGGCTYIIDEVALVEMLEKFGKDIDFVTVLIKKDANSNQTRRFWIRHYRYQWAVGSMTAHVGGKSNGILLKARSAIKQRSGSYS